MAKSSSHTLVRIGYSMACVRVDLPFRTVSISTSMIWLRDWEAPALDVMFKMVSLKLSWQYRTIVELSNAKHFFYNMESFVSAFKRKKVFNYFQSQKCFKALSWKVVISHTRSTALSHLVLRILSCGWPLP